MTDVLSELKTLRKGFGLDDPKALTRIGPWLRLAAGVTDGDDDAATRAKIQLFLRHATATLSAREARAITLGFAVDGSDERRFEARLRQLGRETGCDPRTARRHLDAALQKVAEQACAAMSPEAMTRADLWHLRHLVAHVRLGTPFSEVREVRRVISHRDGLREVAFSYSVGEPPTDPADMAIDVLRGGVRAASERCSATRTRVRVGLPHPLRRSETHGVTLKIITSAPMSFYVCTPQCGCARFDLVVGFRGTSAPDRIWLVQDELPMEAGDPERARIPVPLDTKGSATASFTHLNPNRSYGLAWAPA
ncbi:hypothetical protein [Actinomadura algeriensis]|uniref:Uncharacterized protein n=1 Tax=Actinomadura algeriensis TaxID=1679523 RepID=A0ABR9K2M2_9ACTN|nr:hypothetical protein [Actinomadura algeriensis]MBE1537077.1 hypothetical protein [Actinomadura algeriensis]